MGERFDHLVTWEWFKEPVLSHLSDESVDTCLFQRVVEERGLDEILKGAKRPLSVRCHMFFADYPEPGFDAFIEWEGYGSVQQVGALPDRLLEGVSDD